VTSTAEFLGKLPIFSQLELEELDALAEIVEEYDFAPGAVIAYQRDVANSLYIVREGRLYASAVDGRGIVREARSFLPGDSFYDHWLFKPDVHPATVRASGSGRLMMIAGEKLTAFLEEWAIPLDALTLSERAAAEAAGSRVAPETRRFRSFKLLPDELVKWQARRSRWFFFARAVLPAIGVAIISPLITYFLVSTLPGLGVLRYAPPLLLFLFFVGWLALVVLDWLNDYFVITTKHLIHNEFQIRSFQGDAVKTPIGQVQSVEVTKPSLLATLFNIGTARITTASQQGAIYFDNVDDPGAVRDQINEVRELVRALDAGRAQAAMRHSIEGHFGAEASLRRLTSAEAPPPEPPPGGIMAFLRDLRRRYAYRVEEGPVITYRKHIFVLLQQNWMMWLVWLLLLVGLVFIPNLQIFLFILLVFIVASGYLGWQVEDWRNDLFQVNDLYVVDIDRRPFGFGESRKQTELSNIQTIRARRPNLLATLFNYGHVDIETAGATAKISFEWVHNPQLVQNDITRRQEQFRQQQRVREGERQRKEYAVLLDVYKQAVEQERIPRRTPPKEPDI
jgi:uncharacterized membrane protein YdbT with pleckstrin-like domain